MKQTLLITHKHCPACSSEKISVVLEAKDFTVSQEIFEIWECKNCSLRFTQNIPEENEIGKYYQSEEYISHSNTKKGIINSLYQGVRNFTLKQKRNLVIKVTGKTQGNILDIGCGTGEFLHTLKNVGWNTKGLEPDEGARTFAKENYRLDVEEPTQLFSLEKNTYDLISMWHVLEHVHQLHLYLETIFALLKKDGKLLVAVPNYQSSDADTYGNHWAAYDVPRHLYHFPSKAMENLLGQHDFSVKQKKAMPFDAFYVSLLSEKYLHGKTRLVPAFFSGLRSYLQSRSKVDRCSSILYVIEKV